MIILKLKIGMIYTYNPCLFLKVKLALGPNELLLFFVLINKFCNIFKFKIIKILSQCVNNIKVLKLYFKMVDKESEMEIEVEQRYGLLDGAHMIH